MRAIDMHVHPGTREYLVEGGGKYMADALRYFHKHDAPVSIEDMARDYRAADMIAVLLAWDTETHTGLPPVTNDYVADVVKRYPDTFIGFASVDPWKGRIAIKELERAVRTLGLRGLKCHHRSPRPSTPTIAASTPCGRPVPPSGYLSCSTPEPRGWAPGSPGGTASSFITADRCPTWMIWRPTFPT